MPDIGNSLREARIRQGLSIKDVEHATKIRAKYLEALEQDDYEVLPGTTFVKAFLRTYAGFVKLDADALVEQYRADHEGHGDEVGMSRVDGARQSRTRVTVERKKQRPRRNQRGYALIGIVAVVVVALLAWFGSGRGQDVASIDASNISTSSSNTIVGSGGDTTTSLGSATSTTTEATETVTTAAGENGVVTGENVSLVVTVNAESCWLVIREDSESGAEIYAGTLSAGGQQSFDGSKRYWMMVGRPEVLTVSINGATQTLSQPAGAFVVTEAGIERSQ